MKANELRIGNWVYLTDKEKVWEILDGHEIDECDDNLSVDPIPLTEEWLFKFGFTEQESDIPTFAKVFGQIIEDDYEHCLIINKDIDDNFFAIVMGVKIIFKYVHQIQNFYFVLSEEELTEGGNK